MELITVAIGKPDDVNLVLGQSHFIKTVDDLYDALAGSSPQLRFGLAFWPWFESTRFGREDLAPSRL